MDNITHTMAGWVLGQTGLKAQSRKGLAALMLGANMPDIDVFFGWVPWVPLATHRGFTHGIVGGVLLMPPLLFGLLWLLDRWQVSRGVEFKSGLPMRPWWLLGLCYVGALSHPSLDLLTTYSVQLLSPFSNAWYHADGLFIIDIWLWILLGGTIIWSRLLEKRGGRWREPAQVTVGIVLAYVGLNLLISDRANAAVRNWAGDRAATSIFASPPPVHFWRRGLVWREGACYRWSRYDPFGGAIGSVSACQPTNMDHPLVAEAVRHDPRLRKYLRWSVMPIARIEHGRCSARVTIGDARYGDGSGSRLARSTVVPTGGTGCKAPAPSQ